MSVHTKKPIAAAALTTKDAVSLLDLKRIRGGAAMPIADLTPPRSVSGAQQTASYDLLSALNHEHLKLHDGEDALAARPVSAAPSVELTASDGAGLLLMSLSARRVAAAAFVQRPLPIVERGVAPARFRVPEDEQPFHVEVLTRSLRCNRDR